MSGNDDIISQESPDNASRAPRPSPYRSDHVSSVRRAARCVERYTPERCFIRELANTEDDPEVSIALARVEPGTTTRWHRLHGTTERYCVLEGSGRVEVGDAAPEQVGPGDVVVIAPLRRQRITNIGTSDLVFLAICSPRFVPSAYEDVDVDAPDPA